MWHLLPQQQVIQAPQKICPWFKGRGSNLRVWHKARAQHLAAE